MFAGFDLVGAEDRPNHIGFYRPELLAFQKTCANTFLPDGRPLDIPFLFHAGETLLDTGGSSDPRNSNLYDAALLNSKRIGHGFALMKHPHLLEKFRRTPGKPGSGICVELCPISNELLHLCRNIKEHPFPELLAAGIPCTVNSDNPSLFRYVLGAIRHPVRLLTTNLAIQCNTSSIRSWLVHLRYHCTAGNNLHAGASSTAVSTRHRRNKVYSI